MNNIGSRDVSASKDSDIMSRDMVAIQHGLVAFFCATDVLKKRNRKGERRGRPGELVRGENVYS